MCANSRLLDLLRSVPFTNSKEILSRLRNTSDLQTGEKRGKD
jgi:hypothetical protein